MTGFILISLFLTGDCVIAFSTLLSTLSSLLSTYPVLLSTSVLFSSFPFSIHKNRLKEIQNQKSIFNTSIRHHHPLSQPAINHTKSRNPSIFSAKFIYYYKKTFDKFRYEFFMIPLCFYNVNLIILNKLPNRPFFLLCM